MISDSLNILEDEGYSQISPKIRCRDNFCVGFAGISRFEDAFINTVAEAENWMDAFERVKRKYSEIRWKIAVKNILKPIGCESLEDLKMIGSDEIQSYYLEELKNFDPDLKILMGIYDDEPHLCAVGNPSTGGCFDYVGFYEPNEIDAVPVLPPYIPKNVALPSDWQTHKIRDFLQSQKEHIDWAAMQTPEWGRLWR